MEESMSKRSIQVLAVFAAFALIAAACGDGEVADTTTTPTTQPPEATTTTEGAETTTTGEAAEFEPIPLLIGTLLPQTGTLAPIHDALAEPINMGAEEINELFPDLVTLEHADGATDPAIASENVDRFLTGDHAAIMGAADSGSSTAIVDKVQDAGVVMCSGSNTGASLSVFDPYYIRTAPSDELQTPVLGDLIIDDGHSSVAVVWRTDEYGVGFGEPLAQYLEDSGVEVPLQEGYDTAATSFSDLMEAIGNTDATALAMITFAEGGQMVLDMQGRFDGQVYVADGFVDTVGEDQVGGQVELLEGFRGTYPSVAPASGEPTFPERFAEYAPDTPTVFSAHYYDCLMVVVLAAQKAQSADPTVFIDEVVGVTGPPGEKCSRFADCMELLQAGQDIDYDGASGPLDFLPNGQPGAGTYDLFEFGTDGTHPNFDQVEISQ
jgi:branched-chain amino acid transport system substrate-binding protein